MKLYYSPMSTYSQKTLIAFYEKQVKCTKKVVDAMDPVAMKKFRDEVYALGKIPVLTLENGHKIPESTIIIEFLDSNFSKGTQLIPDAPEKAREARMHDRMADLYLNDPCVNLWIEGEKPTSKQNKELIEKSRYYIDTTYDFLEKHLIRKDWMMGKDFTIADCSAFPALFYLNKVRPFEDRSAINGYFCRLTERPSIAKVIQEVEPVLASI